MSTLKIAIQKSGRLQEQSLELLKKCGLSIENGKDQLKVSIPNFRAEILFLRNSDIPQYLEDGVAHVGIVGSNLLVEKAKNVLIERSLGFSKCRVSLAVPKSTNINSLKDFDGKRIATSYPRTLKGFLDKNGITADIHCISGSVEIAPNIGLADAVCDIVSTGSTLFKNGLVEKQTILQSQAVLACAPSLSKEFSEILEELLFRVDTVLTAKNKKYILMNVPNDKIDAVSALLPVLKAPTVIPLTIPGWSSLHSVIEESTFWEVIKKLKQAGAEGILIAPIDKIVM